MKTLFKGIFTSVIFMFIVASCSTLTTPAYSAPKQVSGEILAVHAWCQAKDKDPTKPVAGLKVLTGLMKKFDAAAYNLTMMTVGTKCIDTRLFDKPPMKAKLVSLYQTVRNERYCFDIWRIKHPSKELYGFTWFRSKCADA